MFSQEFIDALTTEVVRQLTSKLGTVWGSPRKRLFDVREAAEYVGRTPKAIEHLIARGTIPVTKIDGKVQIDRVALDKLIDDHTYFEAA